MSGRLEAAWSYVDPACPINWSCGFNANLVSWYLNLPGGQWGRGGVTVRDLNRRYSNDGTMTGSAASISACGRPGGFGAWDFSNSTTNYISIAANASLNFTSAYSYAFWVNPRTVGSSPYPIGFARGTAALSDIEFYYYNDGTVKFSPVHNRSNGGSLSYCGNGTVPYIVTTAFTAKEWVHVCVTYGANTWKAYINGQYTGTAGTGVNDPLSTNRGWLINNDVLGYCDYYLDDLRLYNRTLSASEALALYTDSVRGSRLALNRVRRWYFPVGVVYNTVVKTFDGNSTWICPPGVTSVQKVESYGGGGGGANNSVGNSGGGGGGGGYSIKNNLSVTPGTAYAIVVGAAGSVGSAGGDSYFDAGADCKAKGGSGASAGTGGAGGLASGGAGDTKYSGGDGGAGGIVGNGGGGGSSAGTGSNGNNGQSGAGGAHGGTAPTGGAAGGNGGGLFGDDGFPGSLPGGGGGGGDNVGVGAAGAHGRVVVTYLVAQTTASLFRQGNLDGVGSGGAYFASPLA